MAAQEGKVDVVRLLTEAEAHVNIQTEVYTLCHVWSTDVRVHLQALLCAYMCVLHYIAPCLMCAYTCTCRWQNQGGG